MRFAFLVAVTALALLATPAAANPRPLGFTYGYGTTPEGQLELEQYIDVRPLEVDDGAGGTDTRLQFDLQTEFELGLSDHWELGFYLVGRQPVDGPFVFRGLKQRVRGRFAEEGELPIDIGIYLEIIEYGDAIEFEEKLILQKRFGSFLALANLSFEQEVPLDGGEAELVFNPSLGIAWAPSPSVSLGLEYRLDGEFEELGEADHYLGPVLMLVKGEYFATIGAYAHLAGESEGDVWVRCLLGIGL
ncbi:MAG: hypothetical protein JNJ59_14545 [Deltaproteobacteria bacterium]|nr:hypothetical protein [Deltaproteobacteria bacterium]